MKAEQLVPVLRVSSLNNDEVTLYPIGVRVEQLAPTCPMTGEVDDTARIWVAMVDEDHAFAVSVRGKVTFSNAVEYSQWLNKPVAEIGDTQPVMES
jgi:SOS-response transcriptional repressor LexA